MGFNVCAILTVFNRVNSTNLKVSDRDPFIALYFLPRLCSKCGWSLFAYSARGLVVMSAAKVSDKGNDADMVEDESVNDDLTVTSSATTTVASNLLCSPTHMHLGGCQW